jgi:hypothetical protein
MMQMSTDAAAQNKAGTDQHADADVLRIYTRDGLTHGLRRWFAGDFAPEIKRKMIWNPYRWRGRESNSLRYAWFRRFSNGFADRYR